MELEVFKHCFGNTYTTIKSLFENYSNENTIEISFNELPDSIFKNVSFEDEYFGKVLTTFAAYQFKIEHENVHNEFQIDIDREINISKIQHSHGFIKYSNIMPISNKINIEKVFTNILYVRKLSISINVFNWKISKIIKITSSKKNHKKLIWNYTIEDVFKPKNYNQIYYKLEYYGYQKDIVDSFINVMNLIYPSDFKIYNRIWYEITQIINIDSIEPIIKTFKEINIDNNSISIQSDQKYYKFKNKLSTIIEYKNKIYEIKDEMILLKDSKFNGLRVFKCDNYKILSILYNSNPEIDIDSFKFVKQLDKDSVKNNNYIVKLTYNDNKSIFITNTIEKYITFIVKNGYLYLRGHKNEIISKDSINNKLSLKHNGYSLLNINIKQDDEVLILFYLPFNHKPFIKDITHDCILKCKLEDNKYIPNEYIHSNNINKDIYKVDTYKDGLDIALANYTGNDCYDYYFNHDIKSHIKNIKTNQFIYELFINRIQDINMIFIIDESSVLNSEILKRLTDINSIFINSNNKYLISSFIKRISNSTKTDIPHLININTKIYDKHNIDISVFNNIENIFTFSNFSINSINVILIFDSLNDSFIDSFKKLYVSLLSKDCIIIFKNNEESIKQLNNIIKIEKHIKYESDNIYITKLI